MIVIAGDNWVRLFIKVFSVRWCKAGSRGDR